MSVPENVRRPRSVFLAVVVLLSSAAGCRSITATVLERRDVQNFTVRELDAQDLRMVRVQGLVMHSALAVQRVDVHTEDGTARIRVVMALARKDRTGSFDVAVHVPASVKQVEFGDERDVIWPTR